MILLPPPLEYRTVVALDTETGLISPYVQAPPIAAVGLSIVGERHVEVVTRRDRAFRRLLLSVLEDSTVRIIAHNASFDFAAIMAYEPEWAGMVLAKYDRDGVGCSMMADILLAIARGNPAEEERRHDLATALQWTAPNSSLRLRKDDPWRTRWGSLAGVPSAELQRDPARRAAVEYLRADVEAVKVLWTEAHRSPYAATLVDLYRQSRAALSLHLMRCWGVTTDRARADAVVASTLATLREAASVAKAAGLIRHDGTRDIGAAGARQEAAYARRGEPAPRHPLTEAQAAKVRARVAKERADVKGPALEALQDLEADRAEGNIVLDQDACEGSGDEAMIAYSVATRATSLLSRAKRLQRPLIQASFGVLLRTGRTSCSQGADPKPGEGAKAWGSQLQNPPRTEGVRECFVARPGWVFLDIDYAMMELRTWAQVCIWQLGYSELAKILNDPTRDPHVEMGGEAVSMPAEKAYALKTTDPRRFKELRSLGKPINFGLPGGLGANTFVAFARQTYGVELVPGGSAEAQKARAKEIKAAWLTKYPEAGPYLQWISWLVSKGKPSSGPSGTERKRTTIRHHQSGLIRGGVGYTDAANSYFQGLAATAAKAAIWDISQAAYTDPRSALYGARPWNFVHDELLVEVQEDRYQEAAQELQERWCGAAQKIVPDVRILAEPSAMRRWGKAAGDPVYHPDGTLAIYEDWLDSRTQKGKVGG